MIDQLIQQTFSCNFKEIKKKHNEKNNKNLTNDAIADMYQLPHGTLSTYLYGSSLPSVETVIGFSKLFEVPFNQFFQGILELNEQDTINQIINYFKIYSKFKSDRLYDIIEPLVTCMISESLPLKQSDFGMRIRKVREESKKSMTDLAEQCGIKESSLKVYESSQKFPRLDTFIHICNALNVSPEYLLIKELTFTSTKQEFYLLTPKQLKALAKTAERLCFFENS